MSTYDVEQALRDRMRAHAAQLDCAMRPTPALRTLLDLAPAKPASGTGRLRLGLALASIGLAGAALVAVLGIAALSGSFWLRGLPGTTPLSSVSPSPSPAVATLSPSPSVSLTVSPVGRTWPPASLSDAVFSPLVVRPSETVGQGR